MRCEDVINELSVPTGEPRPPLLADHLAGCPSCARRAELNARLDRLWEATRPPELSAAAWDRLWAHVTESVDQPQETVSPAPRVSRPWRRSAVAAFAMAQAAALLLCFGLAWRLAPTRLEPQPEPRMTIAADGAPTPVEASESIGEIPTFDIPVDQPVLISFDHRTARDLPTDESSNALSPFSLPMFNAVESLASLQ